MGTKLTGGLRARRSPPIFVASAPRTPLLCLKFALLLETGRNPLPLLPLHPIESHMLLVFNPTHQRLPKKPKRGSLGVLPLEQKRVKGDRIADDSPRLGG